ncbi:MAG: hypothetical protein KKF52_01200 [Nanoarchaeota archaeon]|nr:hypothetical protein [Nanoarchaeota archaeon]MBU4241825.1 hypothetical protein [Nanoarchaeota archaeon]MBU4351922.1 hypothetical protein [Nanoarchaeota archaeon]
MVRSVSRKNMLTAGVLTLSIFIIGILVGVTMSEKRVAYGNEQMLDQKMELDSLQLQYAFIDQAKLENHCAALSTAIEENVEKLGIVGDKIQAFSSDMNFDEEEYDRLKREYVLSEMRFWLFAKKSQEICKKDVVSIIYFYSNEADCFDCGAQSKVLTYLKERLQDRLLIFSIDTSFKGEPLIEMLKEAYGIKTYPSLLINDEIHSGLVDEEDLRDILCEIYEDKSGVC